MKLPKFLKWKELTKKQKGCTLIGIPVSLMWLLGMCADPIGTMIFTVITALIVSICAGIMYLGG
jgi:hypothetical protein